MMTGVTSRVVDSVCGVPHHFEREASFKATYFRVPVFDNLAADLTPYLDDAVRSIRRAKHHGSVLVHCLAGAHRAGTTGCILLMHKAGLSAMEAVATAKKLRPVIDPIGRFPELLRRYECIEQARKIAAKQAAAKQAAPEQ